MQRIVDEIRRTLEALVVSEKIGSSVAAITITTLRIALTSDPALVDRIDNAIFAINLEERNELTEDEANAALDEQTS